MLQRLFHAIGLLLNFLVITIRNQLAKLIRQANLVKQLIHHIELALHLLPGVRILEVPEWVHHVGLLVENTQEIKSVIPYNNIQICTA